VTAKINGFVKRLATTDTGDKLFNPYNEFSKDFDDRTAPGLRQQNLRLYLNSHTKLKTNKLWVYLAPTFFELKRSGIPLTNNPVFKKVEGILSTNKHFENTSKTKMNINNTTLASSLWNVASELDINPLIWPLIPFYPHRKGKPSTKRKPKQEEIVKYRWFLDAIIATYKPSTILAVGKDTKEALDLLKIKSHYVNHPRRSKKRFKRAVSKYV